MSIKVDRKSVPIRLQIDDLLSCSEANVGQMRYPIMLLSFRAALNGYARSVKSPSLKLHMIKQLRTLQSMWTGGIGLLRLSDEFL